MKVVEIGIENHQPQIIQGDILRVSEKHTTILRYLLVITVRVEEGVHYLDYVDLENGCRWQQEGTEETEFTRDMVRNYGFLSIGISILRNAKLIIQPEDYNG